MGGVATTSVPIPPNPALAGLNVFLQSVAQEASLPGGWAFSNGLKLGLTL